LDLERLKQMNRRVVKIADGSQMAFWICRETASLAPHVHDYDEYTLVVQGCDTLVIEGRRIPVKAGEE